MSLLDVRGLHVSFESERGPVLAVRGIDLSLEKGRTLCLVGESGSGKSATAGAVMGLLPPTARVTGTVSLDGQTLTGLTDKQMSRIRGRRIGMVFQDPLSALTPMFTVGRQLSDAVRVHQRVSRATARRRAVELLDLVGIREPAKRADDFPHEFSGGMRQRVVIGLAIANSPELIIADEPTTALDVTVQAQILEVLRTAQRETGAGLLLITHNLGVVAGYADDVSVMYAGRVVEQAGVEPVFAAPRMPYTIGLLGAVPTVSSQERQPLLAIPGEPPQLSAEPACCPFADRCPAAVPACRQGEPALREVARGHTSACVRAEEIAAGTLDVAPLFGHGPAPEAAEAPVPARIPEPTGSDDGITAPDDAPPSDHRPDAARAARPGAEEVVQVRGLVKTYPITKGSVLRRTVGRTTAVRGVDLDLYAGQTLGLVGESGSGKTSTFLELMRLAPPEAGSVELLGTPITAELSRADRARLRSGVQLVMQDVGGSLSPRLTVFDILAEPLQVAGRSRAEIERRVYELLDLVGLARSAVDRFPSAFSGGQRQRIGIARALALEPRVVILDEPVSALDMSVQAEVLNLLVRLQRALKVSFLVIAHDLSVVRYLSDRVAVMYLGTIVETASTAELFEHPRHPYTRALLSASPVPDPRIERHRDRILLAGEAHAADDETGCVFRARCPLYRRLDDTGRARCARPQPLRGLDGDAHRAACHAVD